MVDYIHSSRDDGVFLLTLDNPERLNAMNQDMLMSLVQLLEEAEADDAVRVIIITGRGTHFVRVVISPQGRRRLSEKGGAKGMNIGTAEESW